MDDSSRRKPSCRRDPQARRRSWCCSFAVPPSSPEYPSVHHSKAHHSKSQTLSKLSNSVPNSPQSYKSGLGKVSRMDPRRILSPGRVSPIDSDPAVDSIYEIGPDPSTVVDSTPELPPGCFRVPNETLRDPTESPGSGSTVKDAFDVRLNLRGKKGGCLVLELNSAILSANSDVFAGLIAEYKKGLLSSGSSGAKMCRIEVPEVENFGVFRETIELMFEDDITKQLLKIGVYRCIDILEVSAGIRFNRGISCCLRYLEAVPWTEEEEEKLRSLFKRFKFDDATTRDILGRLYLNDSVDSPQNLSRQLVWSFTSSVDANARNELKSLLKGLLCKSSVYEKDHFDLSKEDLYAVCQSCLGSLASIFGEATDSIAHEKLVKKDPTEDFVDIWADQQELLRMHCNTSPMVRYELSRVSAIIFVAIGTRKLQCRSESRSRLLHAWFSPMMLDFGWLQRCRKGLDMKALEEAMGQALLTLPLRQQYTLFMEWFRCFSKHSTECPNLSKAFQIWWRRSFLRGSETYAIESR
ncbi:BTB/POZ domain-containing protein [Quillaja saponaria]|uniref:BTB/POZ domain-containing protein n=1 Tax=Quillaja saponaria TaxID=32244 RepID=A0AAD7PJ22_QUISA|nr:BTB/POZ domain-containing protein [Quillaja saponaria]